MRFHVKPIPASGTLRAPPATEALHRESARTADAHSRRPAPQYRGSAVHGDRHSVAGRVPHATCVQEHSLTVARTYSIRACPTRRKTGRASDNAGLLTLDFLTPDLLPPESLRSGSTVRCNRAVQPCGATRRSGGRRHLLKVTSPGTTPGKPSTSFGRDCPCFPQLTRRLM